MSRVATVLRAGGGAIALALGSAGAWLVVTGDTVREVRIGTLAGLWGLLIGAFLLFGTRASAGRSLPEPPPPPPPEPEHVTVRKIDARLEDILRREIRASVAREVGLLRAQLLQRDGAAPESKGNGHQHKPEAEPVDTPPIDSSPADAEQVDAERVERIEVVGIPPVRIRGGRRRRERREAG